MVKQQLITVSENVKALVDSLTYHVLSAQKEMFGAYRILSNLQKNENVTFIKVRDELIKKKILSKTAIYNFAKIGSFANGLLLKYQSKLPIHYKTLNQIAVIVGTDNKSIKRLETLIQTNKINRGTEEKDLKQLFNLEKLVDSSKVDKASSIDEEQIENIETPEKDPTKIKIIEIYVDRDLLQDKEKEIRRDLGKIKTLMKYASVNEFGRLQEIILDDQSD